jgi:hypothetical protein
MKKEDVEVGMKVLITEMPCECGAGKEYGEGKVVSVSDTTALIHFPDGLNWWHKFACLYPLDATFPHVYKVGDVMDYNEETVTILRLAIGPELYEVSDGVIVEGGKLTKSNPSAVHLGNELKSKVEFGKKISVSLPPGMVDQHFVVELDKIISTFSMGHPGCQFPVVSRMVGDYPDLEMKETRSGKWAKRYAAIVKEETNVPVPLHLVSRLGEAVERHTPKSRETLIDFDKGCNWKPGDFGESRDSCWWKSYAPWRLGLPEHGGFAMRFWDGDRGIGRAWIFPHQKGLLIFNIYHRDAMSLGSAAQILASYLNVDKFCAVAIDAVGAYVNGSNGYIVGSNEHDKTYKASFKSKHSYWTCASCGTSFRDDVNSCRVDGMVLCSDCYNKLPKCEGCNKQILNTYKAVEGHKYCRDCYSKFCFVCEKCSRALLKTSLVSVEEGNYCEHCLTECVECHRKTPYTYQSGRCRTCAGKETA